MSAGTFRGRWGCRFRQTTLIRATLGFLALTAFVARASAEPPQTAGLPQDAESRLPGGESATILEQAGRQLSRVAATVKPTVVHIESRRGGRNGTVEETGSGVIMTSQRFGGYFVVTNRHVIAGANKQSVKVRMSDGTPLTPSQILEDQATDIAILRLPVTNAPIARWGDSDGLDIGHMVMAVGSPFGLSQSVTLGIISAKGRRALVLTDNNYEVINQDFLQTDAAINPGNSGGPLVDLTGRIIGINTAIASQGGGNEGIGFSIPSNLAKYVVDQMLEHGRVRRGYLGVRLDEEFDEQAALRFNLDRERGAHVLQVYSDTPAYAAGVREDDVILTFDGIDIEDENHLIHLVSLTTVNKTVQVIVLRSGKRTPLNVTLSERPPNRQAAQPGQGGGGTPAIPMKFSTRILQPPIARQVGLPAQTRGLLVTEADEDSGLQLYDVIEEVARRPVATAEQLDRILETIPAGEEVLLKVRRVSNGTLADQLVIWKRPDLATPTPAPAPAHQPAPKP